MAVISCQSLEIAFGGSPLLRDASLQIERGERVGLVGRNGEGKSTLLSILAGELSPDRGSVAVESGARVALFAQRNPPGLGGSVEEVVRGGLPEGGEERHPIARLCSMLRLDPSVCFRELSGGQKRRALLARALASEPDVLLLDEPTNHLDLDGIVWLEDFLRRRSGTLVFVTHDRTFLGRLATRIVELDRGALTSWACDYPVYLRRKEELLAAEEREWARLDRKLAAEEAWIRQGIKARRTRNEGRVRALERLRADRAARRERIGQVRMSVQRAGQSGARVIVARDVSFSYGAGLPFLFRGLSTTIMRGDKVGIIGPNGSGKTTLLEVLLGASAPTSGSVEHGTGLEIVHFDQQREQLDEAASVVEAVAPGSDHVTIDGERRHVLGYLQDFLFNPDRARQPVSSLSGGERNRLLLARLFTRPANVLVLDEPTNDLDAETLELLEARLVEYQGTVLVVSHDRSFLDDVCTSTLVFEGAGDVKEYVGGYSDWRRTVEAREADVSASGRRGVPPTVRRTPAGPRRLTWKEGRELEGLPARIEELERELESLHSKLSDPSLYRGDGEVVRAATERARETEDAIERAFARWSELSELEG